MFPLLLFCIIVETPLSPGPNDPKSTTAVGVNVGCESTIVVEFIAYGIK